jgi:hypothetical protein
LKENGDDLTDVIVMDWKARRLAGATILVSAVVGGLLFLALPLDVVWGLWLALAGFVGASIIELILAWYGEYSEKRGSALWLLVLGHMLAPLLVSPLRDIPFSYAVWYMLAVFFAVGIGAGFEATYIPARTLLRMLKGLRKSGNLGSDLVAGAISESILEEFGPKVLETRILREIETSVKTEEDTVYTKREDTDLEFNLVKIGMVRVLFRVEKELAEVLYVPEDGIVARFERGRETAKRLAFAFRQIVHFAEPTSEQLKRAREDVERGYDKFAAAVVDFKATRKSAAEVWRIRKRAIAASLLALAIVGAGVVALLNANPIMSWLSQPNVNTALGSLAYIAGIILVAIAGVRWLGGRVRRKPSK